MDKKKIKMQLTDLTGIIWRETNRGATTAWEWIHPDNPNGPTPDGVYVAIDNDTMLLEVYTEDNIKVYECDPLKLTPAVKIAVNYAQMANRDGFEWGTDNLPNVYSGSRIVEA